MGQVVNFQEAKIKVLRNNPLAFVRFALGFVVADWQREIIDATFPKTALLADLDERFGK